MKNKTHLIMFIAYGCVLITIICLASCKTNEVKKEKPYVYHEGNQKFLESELVGIKPCNE